MLKLTPFGPLMSGSVFWGSRFRMSEPRPWRAEFTKPPKNMERMARRGDFLLHTFLWAAKEKYVRGAGAEQPRGVTFSGAKSVYI